MSLFKYLSDECLIPLEEGYFRFTQPNLFNDPFESKPHLTSILGNKDIIELINNAPEGDIDEIMKDSLPGIFNKLPKKVKRKLFYSMIKYIPDEIVKSIKETENDILPIAQNSLQEVISKEIGVFCLSKNPNSLLMWAHYANSNKGLIVEFDEKHSFFSKENIKTGNPDFDEYYGKLIPVMYRRNRPSFDYLDKTPPELFLTKSVEWAYEEEYRMIMPLNQADEKINENIYLFKIPFDAIISIRFGIKIDKIIKKKIIDEIKINNSKIKFVDAHLSNEYYEIEFDEIF